MIQDHRKAKLEHMWAIKGILRWFELMSGLKINFKKSSILGMHFDEVWMKGATEFLKCKRGVVSFAYLGMPVGDNQRRRKMWMLIVENSQKNLLGREIGKFIGSHGQKFEECAGGLWSRVLREKNYIRRGGTRVNSYSRRLSKVWKILFVLGYRGEI
ncbi:hypothetical protein SLEP1_g57535 [Rubroshorea leprosula]|uniref:Reverse transcriptase n=1 Tax=Rubroshorea leprosula TaxID=152421 RepID=A0AAV5MMX4_9ROSI|nr:hypothetical protein SLEP1_g57535 [Rubroshorea leprosula]